MRKTGIIVLICLSMVTGLPALQAQEVKKFSLKEAQQYALENNYSVKNTATDVEIAKKRVKENLAIGLPQINAGASYINNIELPTMLIPAEFFGGEPGQFQEIQFGTQHNGSWNASVNQLIFSGQYIVGVMASQSYVDLITANQEKSQIDIAYLIAKSYYPVIILQENKIFFDSTLINLKKMLYESQEYYKNGFLEETDIDQLQLLISNMETTITNINDQITLATNMLKYQMGLKASDNIVLTDRLDNLMNEVNQDYLLNIAFDYNNHIDYKILKNQERMALLDLKLKKSEYLPSLNAMYNYQQDAQRNSFSFFDPNQTWFTSQMLGVSLNVPIFSSGNRKYKVQQSQLQLSKLKVMDEQLKQGLSLKVMTLKSNFNNAYLIYTNKKMSLGNAEKIYNKNEIKYKEGLASSLDLSQSYNQYLTTQIDYLTSILDLLNKKSDLEKELTRTTFQ
jgi:outer membrane protein